MKWFSHIVPCGIADKGVTSLTKVLGKQTSIEAVISPFLKSFAEQFQCNLQLLPCHIKIDTIHHLKKEHFINNETEERLLLMHDL